MQYIFVSGASKHNLAFLSTQGRYFEHNCGWFSYHNNFQVSRRCRMSPLHSVASDGHLVDSVFFPFIYFPASSHARCHFMPMSLTQPIVGTFLSNTLLLIYFGPDKQITNVAS